MNLLAKIVTFWREVEINVDLPLFCDKICISAWFKAHFLAINSQYCRVEDNSKDYHRARLLRSHQRSDRSQNTINYNATDKVSMQAGFAGNICASPISYKIILFLRSLNLCKWLCSGAKNSASFTYLIHFRRPSEFKCSQDEMFVDTNSYACYIGGKKQHSK